MDTVNTVINTTTGSETWPASSSSFHVFVVKQPGKTWEERGLWQAATNMEETGIRGIAAAGVQLSAPDRDADKGKWFSRAYTIPDNTILKLTVNQSAAVWGERRKMAHLHVQVNHRHPLLNISLELTGRNEQPGRALVERAFLYGRLRILTVDEAEALGVRIHPRKRSLFVEDYADVVNVAQIEPGLEPTPADRAAAAAEANPTFVKDVHGTPVQIQVRRKTRAVR
jgi:hypothetical protein